MSSCTTRTSSAIRAQLCSGWSTSSGSAGTTRSCAADDIALRTTRPGDEFHALDADHAVPVAPGEVAYAAGNVVLTRHFVWRQARDGLVEHDSRDVLLVSEILPALGDGAAEHVALDLSARLHELFGVRARMFTLDAGDRSFEWQT